jgi:hypothetical protein
MTALLSDQERAGLFPWLGCRSEITGGSMTSPFRIVIVPGWRNSGPGHWQSLWAEQLEGAVRVQQQDWLVPHRDAWVGSWKSLARR